MAVQEFSYADYPEAQIFYPKLRTCRHCEGKAILVRLPNHGFDPYKAHDTGDGATDEYIVECTICGARSAHCQARGSFHNHGHASECGPLGAIDDWNRNGGRSIGKTRATVIQKNRESRLPEGLSKSLNRITMACDKLSSAEIYLRKQVGNGTTPVDALANFSARKTILQRHVSILTDMCRIQKALVE